MQMLLDNGIFAQVFAAKASDRTHRLTSMHRRYPHLALGVLILGGALWLGGTLWAAVARAPGFTPFVPQALPQGAPGDFDGDGQPDVVLIQDGAEGPHVSVRLSGSPDVVMLDAEVVGVIAADIDRDGDVDLVTAAPSGQVVNWLNDGRGRFTRQQALPSDKFSPVLIVVHSSRDQPVALGAVAPPVGPGTRSETAVLVTRIRPPTNPPAFELGFLSLQSLRAPPLSFSLD
jgi:hypothetical protein